MQSGPTAPGVCSRCGGPNPPQSSFCQFCGSSLLIPLRFETPPQAPPPVLPDNYRLVSSNRDEHEGPGIALLVVGILLAVTGLILFGVAAVVHSGVQSWNNACAQNPACTTPQSDPSGAITGAGVGVLILGIILVIVGVSVYQKG